MMRKWLMGKQNYKNTPTGRATAKKYADIINRPRPVLDRPHMDLVQRAKIFSPYDALRGFDEAIEETDEKASEVKRIELSNEQKETLSDKLLQVSKGMMLSVQYFSRTSGEKGKYQTLTGTVVEIDPIGRTLSIQETEADTTGGKIEKVLPTIIRFDDLFDVTGPGIKDIDEYLGIEWCAAPAGDL